MYWIIFLVVIRIALIDVDYIWVTGTLKITLKKSVMSIGQYIGYKTLTSAEEMKIYLYNLIGSNVLVDTSWDGQSSYVFYALQARWPHLIEPNEAKATPSSFSKHNDTPALLVVDIGAHDGIWLSNSHYFIQAGFGGLLVEPNPETFSELRRTWKKALVINSSSTHAWETMTHKNGLENISEGQNITKNNYSMSNQPIFNSIALVEAAIGFERSKGDIIERGWMDKTETAVRESVNGNVSIVTLPELLRNLNVPKQFAVLSMDVEWKAMNYVKALSSTIQAGWRPEFVILELSGNIHARQLIEGVGFKYLKTFRYDDIFSIVR